MIQRRAFVARIAGLVAVGVTSQRLWAQVTGLLDKPTPITVYKSSSCECCAKWVDHIRASGFAPEVHDEEGMDGLKDRLGVPENVRSCHTGQVDGYLVEGHVPASDIRRLLDERPKSSGLAVPGMPPRTYGMAPPGVAVGGYEVVSFQRNGKTAVFARH
ncbi:MAG: DUF411 domain-containing protein [Gemmatimonadales bacterium]